MKNRCLAHRRASWRDHFLAIAREAPVPPPVTPRFARGSPKPGVRAMASALRARVMAGASAA